VGRRSRPRSSLYIGVDVGGTKVLAALVEADGTIVARKRRATPRKGTPEEVLATIFEAMEGVLADEGVKPKRLAAVGLTIPGVVDPEEGRVVVTPNMNLDGLEIVPRVRTRFGVPVALGNDVNMGTLGEQWLGAARDASSAFGIFVGTGIGGGLVVDGKLVCGCREAAGEVGHTVMQIGGPLCGCGNHGCLEALASRSAIEREIRAAVAKGRKSVITELVDLDKGMVKSKALRRALDAGDRVVTRVMRKASEVLGYACLTVRHLLDPDVIVLGGGVVEACGGFVLPVVRDIMEGDALPGARVGSYVVESELGDDAVVLGAVALAQQVSGSDPIEDAARRTTRYPRLGWRGSGQLEVDGKRHTKDMYIRADGKVKRRSKKIAKTLYGDSHQIGPKELKKVCKGRVHLLVIGAGEGGTARLTPDGADLLRQRGIRALVLPTEQAVDAYNRAWGRKAALVHVTC